MQPQGLKISFPLLVFFLNTPFCMHIPINFNNQTLRWTKETIYGPMPCWRRNLRARNCLKRNFVHRRDSAGVRLARRCRLRERRFGCPCRIRGALPMSPRPYPTSPPLTKGRDQTLSSLQRLVQILVPLLCGEGLGEVETSDGKLRFNTW